MIYIDPLASSIYFIHLRARIYWSENYFGAETVGTILKKSNSGYRSNLKFILFY